MKREPQKTEECPPKVPGYIVTYSDMVTLLLTFFVMLQAMSYFQDPELFNKGRGSFLRAVRGFGLGMLLGRRPYIDFGNTKIKYFISTPEKILQSRTIHAREEELRRIFKKVDRSMTTMPSQIVAERPNFLVSNIRFLPGEATLDEPAKRFLTEFCLDLQQNDNSKAGMLYVLGLADETSASSAESQATEKQQWIISARRAQAVADFLGTALSSESGSEALYNAFETSLKWGIFWWGAGPGGDWVRQDNPISRHSQILIAVLRASD